MILFKSGSKSSECWFISIPASRYWSKSHSRSKAWNWDWYNSLQIWRIHRVFSKSVVSKPFNF